jgi:hypothetical protein
MATVHLIINYRNYTKSRLVIPISLFLRLCVLCVNSGYIIPMQPELR